ncbi:GNAT family N-acetyltransferase [Yoonia vestfoldensis]|uniref:GNAT family N-acetyltransferase n=1 Tax=Yoonia vestfoldensis TaxID=245188 RepID=UPI001FE113B5|nr:GNAT family N-acetyltransferase [Yoonia vestfoldensis]
MRDSLTARYPDRALVLRSLNTVADGATIETLRAAGFELLPARQIYLFDGAASDPHSTNMKRDRRALAQTDLRLVADDGVTDADYARAARLYEMLYIDKYTPLNPRYSALYLRRMHGAGLMRLRGLRAMDGELVAVTGLFVNGRTLTQPIVGYDTTRPQQEGLYRMVMAMAQDIALAEGLFFNMSAGAASFKRHRQAVPVIEYTAVYAAHLPRPQRSAVRFMRRVLVRVGIPLLQRFAL